MGIFSKKKEVLHPDPLVNLIMGWADKMASGKFPYDKRVINMSLELLDMDCKMSMQKAEFVLEFFRNNKIQGIKGESLVERLEEDMKLLKKKYDIIVEMKEKIKKNNIQTKWKGENK
jgi:hypothetical protein